MSYHEQKIPEGTRARIEYVLHAQVLLSLGSKACYR
jgi:hypothetical protein